MYLKYVNPTSVWAKIAEVWEAIAKSLVPPPPEDASKLLLEEERIWALEDSPEKYFELSKLYDRVSDAYRYRCQEFDYTTQVKAYKGLSMKYHAMAVGMQKSNAVLDF